MRITRWGEYGILCSLYLGSHYGRANPVSAQELAENHGIPQQYTQQILQRLRKGKIIESVRGPKGGYKLLSSPNTISLRNVLLAAEGSTFKVVCDDDPVNNDLCKEPSKCGLHSVWRGLEEVINTYLESKTLADVLQGHDVAFLCRPSLDSESVDPYSDESQDSESTSSLDVLN